MSIFLFSSDKDKLLIRQLEDHLSVLKQRGLISTWHKRKIVAGANRVKTCNTYLEQASILLLLVNPDFLAHCDQVEIQRALERHERGEARVIPVLLRPADWKGAAFGHLQPLPSNEIPISSWRNRDEAFLDVVEGIKKVLEQKEDGLMSSQEPLPPSLPLSPLPLPSQRNFPPIWNVPYRYTPFFTGRDQVVEQLFDSFTSVPVGGIVPVQALTGLGGIGKTQTAVAYAFRHRKQYQSVFWIKAETEGELVTSFTNMAKLLALPGINVQERQSVLDGIHEWLSNATDYLLILDNADNLKLVNRFLSTRLVNGHLLLTSRPQAMAGLAQPLLLIALTPEDGALCLLRRASYIPWNADLSVASLSATARKAALDLSELMGGLPLALEQAGAYIEATGRGVRGYLELYEQYRPEIQKNQYGDILYYRTAVAFAWNLAREVVQMESPAAIELLYLCAYLAPDAILYQLFPKDASILGPTLGPVAAHHLTLDNTFILLRRHSLIQHEVDKDTDAPRIFLHRVLQEILRDSMGPETQHLWAGRAVRIVGLALPVVEWSLMQAHAEHCLSLIDKLQMDFREADVIRQYVEQKCM